MTIAVELGCILIGRAGVQETSQSCEIFGRSIPRPAADSKRSGIMCNHNMIIAWSGSEAFRNDLMRERAGDLKQWDPRAAALGLVRR